MTATRTLSKEDPCETLHTEDSIRKRKIRKREIRGVTPSTEPKELPFKLGLYQEPSILLTY